MKAAVVDKAVSVEVELVRPPPGGQCADQSIRFHKSPTHIALMAESRSHLTPAINMQPLTGLGTVCCLTVSAPAKRNRPH